MDNLKPSRADIIEGEISTEFVNCPECQSNEVIRDPERGESICAICGLVIEEKEIDTGREGRRAFSSDEKSKRDQTGSPISVLLPDLGLTTVIDANSAISQRMKRIIKWNTRMSWSNRNMLIAATEIKRIGGLLNLPLRVKEYAAKIYRKAFHLKLLRGRSIKSMVAATLYYACRAEKIPRTLQEILVHSESEPREVRRCYRTIIRELKLSVPTLDPSILIPKYASALDLNNDIEKTANKIIQLYSKRFPVGGKDPKGLVSASIYCACLLHKINRSQSRIAKIIGVTEVTLRSRYKEIARLVHLPDPVEN